jgi:anti-anti-sigma factor
VDDLRAEPGLAGLIVVKAEADGPVLHLSGDVDAAVVQRWERDHDLTTSRIVAVDVGQLRYIDSTGLAMLVTWAQSARREGHPARIRCVTTRFLRVLEVCGLEPMFELT